MQPGGSMGGWLQFPSERSRKLLLYAAIRGVFLLDIPSCFHSNNSKGLHRPDTPACHYKPVSSTTSKFANGWKTSRSTGEIFWQTSMRLRLVSAKGIYILLMQKKKQATTWHVKNPVNNGINYQPQPVSRISEPSTVCSYMNLMFIRKKHYQ